MSRNGSDAVAALVDIQTGCLARYLPPLRPKSVAFEGSRQRRIDGLGLLLQSGEIGIAALSCLTLLFGPSRDAALPVGTTRGSRLSRLYGLDGGIQFGNDALGFSEVGRRLDAGLLVAARDGLAELGLQFFDGGDDHVSLFN